MYVCSDDIERAYLSSWRTDKRSILTFSIVTRIFLLSSLSKLSSVLPWTDESLITTHLRVVPSIKQPYLYLPNRPRTETTQTHYHPLTMIEDEIYRKSSQYRLWSFTSESLQSLRVTTNAVASDRVRAAQRRARETQQASNSSTSTPNPSDTDSKAADEKTVDCLTPEEEQDLVRYYCEQTVELGERYRPPLPTIVRVCPFHNKQPLLPSLLSYSSK